MTFPKSLPARPSLDSLRRQAKKLVRDSAAGDADAIARAQTHLPTARLPLSQRDAQLVLARDYGFPGWRDLKSEVLRRLGTGLEWAADQADCAIYANDTERLKQLLAEYPDLLAWRDEGGFTLLQATTSYANDTSYPEREAEYNRPDCAEILIDAGIKADPPVWERVVATGSAGMLRLLRDKGALPEKLPILAALGDLNAVRGSFDRSGVPRVSARPSDADALATANEALLAACRFKHKAVATFLLERCIALDPDLGVAVDDWQGHAAFIAYLCDHASHEFARVAASKAPPPPWTAFVMRQLRQAMDDGDLPAFVRWLQSEKRLLGEAGVAFQVKLLEDAAVRGYGPFIEQLLDLNPAVLTLRVPPQADAVKYAVEYGHADLVPPLTRIWPLADDLPHAAGTGDLIRVRRWFDDAGQPTLGNLNAHYPVSHPLGTARLGWGANDLQRILDTALAWACMNRKLDVAAFMLEHGADINTRWATHEPASILHECALNRNYEAVRFLLDRGIDPTIRCHRYNATAQGWAYNAAKDMEMTELLAAAEEAWPAT